MSEDVFNSKILNLRACKHEKESVAMRNLSVVRDEYEYRASVFHSIVVSHPPPASALFSFNKFTALWPVITGSIHFRSTLGSVEFQVKKKKKKNKQ